MHLKISSAKRRPFFPGGDELTKPLNRVVHSLQERVNRVNYKARWYTIYNRTISGVNYDIKVSQSHIYGRYITANLQCYMKP